jgi:hypothetical protein
LRAGETHPGQGGEPLVDQVAALAAALDDVAGEALALFEPRPRC